MRTVLGAFTVGLDYRNYGLSNQSKHSTPGEQQSLYKLKSQMHGLNTTLAVFDGFDPIKLLAFLASI